MGREEPTGEWGVSEWLGNELSQANGNWQVAK